MILFDINEAFKIKNHYKDIIIGTPLTIGKDDDISGILVCHKGNVNKAIEIMLSTNFDEEQHLIASFSENAKEFEIYVYHYDGADILYHELDKFITERNLQKIYSVN
ncbi:MAG: hypothetical protein IPJ81_06695 [Chitinophagaceae bacterium]|nr:hypothetical protein [Chitinophagaceae bacterium]